MRKFKYQFNVFITFMLLASVALGALTQRKIPEGFLAGASSIGNSTTMSTKAILDLKSTTKGLLLPRMTTTQRDAITSPPEGLVVWNITTNSYDQYDGSSWERLATTTGAETFSSKGIDADTNTLSNIDNGEIKAAAAIALNKLAAATASRALVSDGSGFVSPSATTSTQIDYLSTTNTNVMSAINGRIAQSSATAKGDVFVATASGVVGIMSVAGGSDGQQLTLDSARAHGMKWATSASALSGPGQLLNLGCSASVASNALTIALTDGSNTTPSSGSPAKISFKSATLDGQYAQISADAATTITISSGSTLGHVAGQADFIDVFIMNSSGTPELAVTTNRYVDEYSTQSTTAEGGAGAADTRNVLYSTTTRANLPMRRICRLSITETVAGLWATAPSNITVFPFQRNTITTESFQQERLLRASVATACTGSPCTVTNSSGDVSSITRVGTGSFIVAWTSGAYSSAPSCWAMTTEYNNAYLSMPTVNRFTFIVADALGVATDAAFQVICYGPR